MDMKIGLSPQEKNTDSECSRILVMKIKGPKKLIKGKTKNTAKFFLFIKLGSYIQRGNGPGGEGSRSV